MKRGLKVQFQARQGDVLIEEYRGPALTDLGEVPNENGRVILAHGEATGHAHALDGKAAKLYEARQTMRRILRVIAQTPVVHEEHHRPDIGKVINLAERDHEVIRQVEYHPEEIRQVQD